MEIKPQPKLKFVGVHIINVQFKASQEITKEKSLNINIEPTVFYPEDNTNAFSILMTVSISHKEELSLTVHSVGNFLVETEGSTSDQDFRKSLVNANAPAIMFPYLRAFISTFTSNLGGIVSPIILPTQFFQGELKEHKPSVVE
ncbi:protein-export chaperone SecB [Pseudobacter ginsenosidimutans]|uniref:Preprotein translocase subunit SecB n=1 Tax=Pseudobacter ginsenosidimutans TaxID=661488 RepID=A0A4Q7MS81_9BACT|nr:protein-export chaperone SecB [Pseudobacter ginsenosidimutans]QEC41563.1 hypothetical protein FSB84_07570 [Pseudobacter ginsenosidimutans]RZS71652.1 preprotein translocase subunit SecB [Pseudobacter ginsenosidimutans]